MSRRDIASWSGAVGSRCLPVRLIGFVLVLLAGLCSPQLWAATCSSVFPASITGRSVNQFDLSGVTWQNTPALGARNRSLGAGDHYFGGGGTANGWALAATGGASTRVFVNGSLSIANNSQLNAGGNPEDLILVINGSLSLGNNAVINGFVYVTGSISFGNNLQLDGAITAAGATNAPGGGTSLNYNDAAIDLADFGSLCSPIELRLSWSLDESAWSGAANEVIDASGNGLNGRAVNGASTASSVPALATANGLGTCGYGDFDSAANQYVQRAHNSLLTLQDSFTIGLWVKPDTLPASGLMSILSKDETYEFHLRPNGTVNWWWQTTGPTATREFDSTVALTPGQWSHVLIRFAPSDQRIYINGNLAGQARFSGTPLANSDPLQLGADQNFSGRYFNGQLDELRIYSGALSEAAISALVAERHACALVQIDHFDFAYANPALTCNPHPITLRACSNADCSSLYTGLVNVTLAPSSGWNATGEASISNGNILEFEDGVANLRLGHSVAEVVTVGASLSTPPPNNQTVCSTPSCQITYADSGFLIDVPNTLAAKPTPASITAVSKPDDLSVCVPTFQGVERTISFTSVYTNPATGSRPVMVSDDNSAEANTPTSIALSFDATGRAPFSVRYEDAGLMTLSASYIGSEGTGDAGVALVGSDTFVSKPYSLLLQTNTSSGCTDPDITCPLFPDGFGVPGGVRAGDPFDLRISAVAWQSDGEALTAAELADNLITPNFQMGDIGLSSLVVGPSGGVNGVVAPGEYDHALGGVTTVATTISEVGVFNLIATPTTDYIEENEVVSGGTSGLVGRFIPAYLDAIGSASLTPSCGGSFSYQGQPMNFAVSREPLLTVSGHNRQGAVTQNYDRGEFWRLVAPAVGSYSSTTGLAVDVRLVTQGTASLSVEGADNGDGARGYRWSGEQLLYTPAALPVADDLPFMAAISQSFSAASLTDADGACYGSGAACEDFSYPFTDDPGSEVRLGRLRIGNAHGSELQALNLPLTVESWQATAGGNSFAPEGLDNCTAAVLGAPVLDGFTGSLAAGETTPSLSGPLAGSGLVGLTAPGAGNEGSVRVSFLPALPPTWLYYDWSGNGREMASGLATFGIYRGAAPLIFRRELYR